MAKCGSCMEEVYFDDFESMQKHMKEKHDSEFKINPFTGEKVK